MKMIKLTCVSILTFFILIIKSYSTDIEANSVKFNYSVSGLRCISLEYLNLLMNFLKQ